MNILQLRTEFSDNGPGTQTLTISTELRSRGHKVVLASSGGHLTKKIKKAGFEYYIIPEIAFGKRTFFNLVKSILSIRKILIKEKISIVHAHNATSVLLANIASFLAFKKVKFFQSVRGVEIRENYGWRNRIYNLAKYNAMFAVSKFTKKAIVNFGVNSKKVIVTYNGVDLNRFDINKRNEYRLEIRNEFNIPQNAFVIGIVGRQDGIKGHKDLIKTFKLLYESHPNLYVILVGGGSETEINRKLSIDMGINDRCIFTGLRLDVEKIHAAFDIFTLLSKKGYEMFPNVIIESMSYGNPFVGTNTTGVPEAAERGEGFICESDDIECFREKFDLLINDKHLKDKMSQRAKKSVEEIFNITKVVDKIEKTYKQF
ncbi:glycosyltransferase [Polaribacter uvawellassae]|uniref:glycosyltransferase n=1 Tax=Polaribacter uvawellassae TaxID=3133495 RepID=UPI00321A01B8